MKHVYNNSWSILKVIFPVKVIKNNSNEMYIKGSKKEI